LDGDGQPIDITADSVKFDVRDIIGGSLKLTKTNASGSHSDPINGKTQFTIARTDITDTLTDKVTCWKYEIRRILVSTDEAVHITGDFNVHLAIGG
jgi:hypothetical protein